MSVCISTAQARTNLGLAAGIFPVNYRAKWLLCNVHVYFDFAGSRKVCFPVLGSVFLLNIIIIIMIIIIIIILIMIMIIIIIIIVILNVNLNLNLKLKLIRLFVRSFILSFFL